MWSSTISTSATVLMISRCPGDQTSNDCNRYRSGQPVNRYVSCSCYPLSSAFAFLYQSPPGFSLSAGHGPYPAPSAADAPAADFPGQPPGPLPAPVVVHAAHSPAAQFPVQLWQPAHAPARQSPDSLLCFAIRQVRFVLCHFTDNFIRTAFRFTADGLFSLPLCQYLCRDRLAISGSRLDAVVRDIPHTRPPVMAPGFHGRPSPAILTTTPLSGLSRAIRTPSCILSASRLSPLRLPLQGHELRIPAAFHTAFTTESPQPVSIIRGQRVQPDTG